MKKKKKRERKGISTGIYNWMKAFVTIYIFSNNLVSTFEVFCTILRYPLSFKDDTKKCNLNGESGEPKRKKEKQQLNSLIQFSHCKAIENVRARWKV